MTQINLILVDENDNQIGVEEKLKAHEEGKLHRAFSVYIFNSKNELLLQRRDINKYHSGGLWTNTACGHPSPGEELNFAAKKRLNEEMGIITDLNEIFSITYKSEYDNGLCEHEFLHIFVGDYEENPVLNKEEAMDFKWIKIDDLLDDVKLNPENYTSWFKILLSKKDFIDKIKR